MSLFIHTVENMSSSIPYIHIEYPAQACQNTVILFTMNKFVCFFREVCLSSVNRLIIIHDPYT